jgi:hypothetical protein
VGDSLDINLQQGGNGAIQPASELPQEQEAQMMPRLRDIVSSDTGKYFHFFSKLSLLFEN